MISEKLLKYDMSLEERVAKIEARNAKVEADKAWETSWVRRFSIALLTYGVIDSLSVRNK